MAIVTAAGLPFGLWSNLRYRRSYQRLEISRGRNAHLIESSSKAFLPLAFSVFYKFQKIIRDQIFGSFDIPQQRA